MPQDGRACAKCGRLLQRARAGRPRGAESAGRKATGAQAARRGAGVQQGCLPWAPAARGAANPVTVSWCEKSENTLLVLQPPWRVCASLLH